MTTKASIKTSLYVIAIIAIIWFISTIVLNITETWWFMPLIAIITGLFSVILSAIEKRLKVVISILSTGWTILLYMIAQNFLNINLTVIYCLLAVIAIATELYSYNFNSLWEIIFDLILGFPAAFAFFRVEDPIFKILIIWVYFILVILISFKASFSLKHDEETNKKPRKVKQNHISE